VCTEISSSSSSAKSFARPPARLFRFKSSKLMTGTNIPSKSAVTLREKQSAKVTPSMEVNISRRSGGTPIRSIPFGSLNRLEFAAVKPNCCKAETVRTMLSGVGEMQTAISPVEHE